MSDKRISNQFLEKSFIYNTRLSNFIAIKRNNSHIETENKNENEMKLMLLSNEQGGKAFFSIYEIRLKT